jgi:glutamate-1-semialdehyde aminotransferase
VPVLCGLAFLDEVAKPGFYAHLQVLEQHFDQGMDRIIRAHDLNMVVPHHGARFNVLLGRRTPARRYEDTFCHDVPKWLSIIRGCWERGVYFHDYGGGPLHHGYSVQHTETDIDRVLNVMEEVLVRTLK